MIIKEFMPDKKMSQAEKNEIADFLHQHLEQYRDDKEAILLAINYAQAENSKPGGFVLSAYENDVMAGAVVVNKTGMEGYIPENILVYIAVNSTIRGKGVGKKLMAKTLELAKGSVKLHVEHENPARFLYEKFGFVSKYLEMRLTR